MAKEPTLEEAWDIWKKSGNPELMDLADRLAPQLTIRDEFRCALRNRDYDRAAYIGNVIKKYAGPKDTLVLNSSALKALHEIRAYKPSNRT